MSPASSVTLQSSTQSIHSGGGLGVGGGGGGGTAGGRLAEQYSQQSATSYASTDTVL